MKTPAAWALPNYINSRLKLGHENVVASRLP